MFLHNRVFINSFYKVRKKLRNRITQHDNTYLNVLIQNISFKSKNTKSTKGERLIFKEEVADNADLHKTQTSIQSVFGFVRIFQGLLKKNRLEKLVSPVKKAPSSTHLLSKILPGGVSLKLTKSLLYFHEKQMLKRGRVYLKRFNYKSFIKSFIKKFIKAL